MIICAAIKLVNKYGMFDMELEEPEELIVCGLRHGNCIQTIKELDEKWYSAIRIKGFINHKNEFLDCKEAFKYIQEVGQCSMTQKWYWVDNNLYELSSEDLY